MRYRTEHFRLEELVPPEIFHRRGEAAWELLDPSALVTLDALRQQFGCCIVNDWHAGGRYTESGFREPKCEIGAVLSQHRFGRAFDCKFETVHPIEASAYILAHPNQFPHLTTLEDVRHTPTWLHFDTRNNPDSGIRVVLP